jgi:hypothetical protein
MPYYGLLNGFSNYYGGASSCSWVSKATLLRKVAKKKLNPKLEILSEGMAIIPTDWQTELTTYEFKGKVDEKNFIVYINVENGKEEKVFMIIDTPGGTLAI